VPFCVQNDLLIEKDGTAGGRPKSNTAQNTSSKISAFSVPIMLTFLQPETLSAYTASVTLNTPIRPFEICEIIYYGFVLV